MPPWKRPIGGRLAAAALVALLLPPAVRVAAQPSTASVCDLTPAERLVAGGGGGGRVHGLIGNHEVMRMSGYLQDVSEQEYRAFRNGQSEELRELVAGKLATEAAARARAATGGVD